MLTSVPLKQWNNLHCHHQEKVNDTTLIYFFSKVMHHSQQPCIPSNIQNFEPLLPYMGRLFSGCARA
jgi:hypothetical protein